MSAPHRIRLTAAWDPPAPGRERWHRSFGRPGGLVPGDRVWLVIEAPMGAVTVNGADLRPAADPGSPWRADVTALLRERNDLLVACNAMEREAEPGPARRPLPSGRGDVFLEIVPAS